MSASFLAPTSYAVVRDKERFERELLDTLNKALANTETAPKEKHVRSAIISTHQERGCASFWKVLRQFPLLRQNIVCWKACLVVHRVFLDGYPDVVTTSKSHVSLIADLGKHWGKVVDGYSKLIGGYCKVLITKIHFHLKYPDVPHNLLFQEKPFQMPADVNEIFQMAVDVFDLQSSILHLMGAIVSQLDPSKGISAAQVQCRIHPLIACINESSALYDLIYKLMKTLHSTLPPETLAGHRERFNRQYMAMRKYFNEARKMKYFDQLVNIPVMQAEAPQFVLPGTGGGSHDAAAVTTKTNATTTSDEELTTKSLPVGRISQVPPVTRLESDPSFSAAFGHSSSFDKEFDFNSFASSEASTPANSLPPWQPPVVDEKNALLDQMAAEIVQLKARIAELESDKAACVQEIEQLKQQLTKLQRELDEYKEIAEQACRENVTLKEQLQASEAPSSDEKLSKLKTSYLKLRDEHVQLLRDEGEARKQLTALRLSSTEVTSKNKSLEESTLSLQKELEEARRKMEEAAMQQKLLANQIEEQKLKAVELEQSAAKQQTAGSHDLLVKAVESLEGNIRKAMQETDDPSSSGVSCTPEHLLSRATQTLNDLDVVANAFCLYNNDPDGLSSAILSVTTLSQSLCSVLEYGVGSSHLAPEDSSEKLLSSCRSTGEESLKLLQVLKQHQPGSGTISTATNNVQKTVRQLSRLVEELLPQTKRDSELLGDVVEEEMAATALAVDEAAARIAEMLEKAKQDDSGAKLEVNSRILDSCTELMACIKLLIQRSQDLQIEIVGMGGGQSANEFYKKYNRWSEGLISAAKAVGWGASILVDSADKCVQGTGKFEELVVASHDIAASTAQLVAASRAKARPKSEKLKGLKAASRRVTEATGSVVASAQSGATMKQQSNKPDYTKLTLTQAKRQEMESQVHALELERELEEERTRLAELRKIHYHLGGSQEGWEDTDAAD